MNKLILFTVLLIALVPFISTAPFEDGDSENAFPGQQKFFISLLQTLRQTDAKGIDFFSPHSIYQALLLAYIGAEGETEASLKQLLYLDESKSKNEIIESYQAVKALQLQRLEDKNLEFNSVNKFYVTDDAILTDLMKTKFADTVEKVNFKNDPNGVREQINKFVESITKGNIRELLAEGSILPSTSLAVANAAYFKGKWEYRFDVRKTKKSMFNGYSSVDMMKLKAALFTGRIDELDADFIEMPYTAQDGVFSMFVLLPNENSSSAVDTMLDRLTLDHIDELWTGGMEQDVIVQFPKFEMENEFTLKETLSVMGLENLFENANFEAISKSIRLGGIDDMVHKSKILVDENGATAAAASGSLSRRLPIADQVPKRFICDHSFAYFIFDRQLDEVLFAGVYRGK